MNKNVKGFVSVMLSGVMLIVMLLGMVTMKACSASDDAKFNRAVAALQTAPALIASFTNATIQERAKLDQYFADAVSALQAYKQSRTDENFGAFVTVLANIAAHHVSDSTGSARIAAIVGTVRIILGIPEQALAIAQRGGVVSVDQPDLSKIKETDVQRLEELMKPLPR